MDELKSSAVTVNNLLSKYIDLHNEFLKSSGSIWSIFKKINYESMSSDAYTLFEQLRNEKNNIEQLISEAREGEEKEFAEKLCQYTNALTETNHLLFILLHALSEKANGEKLSMSEHMENNKRYQKSIEVYVAYGEELNTIYASLRSPRS